ncbi:hypothetical protein CH255_19300 [Rhodococcus sp. 05-2255-2A2]|uniref:hypothetical protein n=1 Tax=unclassified Rhodococcus (in: high G+C Gram-positive bacteria) TaxID=192944 RepID=UPI000B9B0D74|nr:MULTISPECIES: hypothetical protein [unclassified Rhodococcus (in: high G+C Gram-positive bacteria)]OZE03856.1 hypothetical protein CH250_22445 [Rhodococcus sp. 05-2255-3C]OZE17052.1 hypothetical protein CH255_19300 [Rhodococcus sp. 05-2255-2A2]
MEFKIEYGGRTFKANATTITDLRDQLATGRPSLFDLGGGDMIVVGSGTPLIVSRVRKPASPSFE